MFKQSDLKSTLRFEEDELQALLDEDHSGRPTLPVSYGELSELLFLDVMSDLDTENFEVVS